MNVNNFFNERFLYYIEWTIIIQLIIVALLVSIIYCVKIYFYIRNKLHQKRFDALKKALTEAAEAKLELSKQLYKKARKSIEDSISIIKSLDETYSTETWQTVKFQLLNQVLLPIADQYTASKNWYKRYLATQCYFLYCSANEEQNLLKLTKDPVTLVAINAAEAAVKSPSQKLIDAIIDNFAEGRHMRQTTFAQVLANIESNLTPFILKKLTSENNIYSRAFCYRLLTCLPPEKTIVNIAFEDINNTHFELKKAALKYLAHSKAENIHTILEKKMDSEDWQVRSTAVSILGQLQAEDAAELIAEKLKDPEWWVRINAAQALSQLGKKGYTLLKQQDPSIDRYAYEAALQVLKTKKKST